LVLNMLAVYMLDSQGSIPGRDGNCLFSKASRLAMGAHPASYSVGTNAALPRLKWLAHVADHSPLSSIQIKNEWSHTSILPYGFMVCKWKT